MSAHPNRGISRRGRAVTVGVLLLCTVALKMIWTWTGETTFLLASALPVLAIAALFLWGREHVTFEVIGGPWDGARVPVATVAPDTDVLVLHTYDGEDAQYAVEGRRSLVYQGQSRRPG